MQPITRFNGGFFWLSNFARCEVMLDGQTYQSVEHAYQAAKSLDPEYRKKIKTMTAGEAKRAGRRTKLRLGWEGDKLDVMEGLLRQKFNISGFREDLIATGDAELIEGNDWGDVYWGKCHGQGANHLGRLIMKIRDELKGNQ